MYKYHSVVPKRTLLKTKTLLHIPRCLFVIENASNIHNFADDNTSYSRVD